MKLCRWFCASCWDLTFLVVASWLRCRISCHRMTDYCRRHNLKAPLLPMWRLHFPSSSRLGDFLTVETKQPQHQHTPQCLDAFTVSVFYLELSSFLCYSLDDDDNVFSLFTLLQLLVIVRKKGFSLSSSASLSCYFRMMMVFWGPRREMMMVMWGGFDVRIGVERELPWKEEERKWTSCYYIVYNLLNIIRHNEMSVKWQARWKRAPIVDSIFVSLLFRAISVPCLRGISFIHAQMKERKIEFWFLLRSRARKTKQQNKTEREEKEKNLNHLQTHQRQPTSRICIKTR